MKTQKLKLKPSARDKRRYFIVSGENLTNQKIETSILNYIGILGFSKSAYQLIQEKPKLIASCSRESLNNIRASLLLEGFKIKKVSGTIKGLKN